MLYDNLYQYGFSEEEVRLAQSPDKKDYLLDRLRADHEQWEARSLTKGLKYWDAIRAEFRDPQSPYAQLEPDVEDEAQDPKLFQALVDLLGEDKSVAKFEEWCQEVSVINQTTCCAFFRAMLKTPPSKNLDNANMVALGMGVVALLELKTTYPRLVELMAGTFHACLQKTWIGYQNEEMTTKEWWEDNKEIASLLLPEASMDAVTGHQVVQKDWSPIEDHVHSVYESGSTGEKLMAKIKRQIEADSIGAVVKRITEKLNGHALNQAALDANRKEFVETLKTRGIDPSSPYAKKKKGCVHLLLDRG